MQRNRAASQQASLKIAAILQVLPSNRTGESVPSNPAGKFSGAFLCRAQAQSDFTDSIKRMQCDHKPIMRRKSVSRHRDDFTGAVNGNATPANLIGKAVRFFTDAISETVNAADSQELRRFYNFLLGGVEFVHVNLDGENPYKIFRSLNSTGVDLSPADLIRNFVFTHVSNDV